MSMKSRIGLMGIMAQMAMMGGGMPSHLSTTYIPHSKPIPFTFKKFRLNEDEELPKGCDCTNVDIVFSKPPYKITVNVDIVHGTKKAGRKKFIQYSKEIGGFIYGNNIEVLKKYSEDILIEEVKEETKNEA